MGEAKSRKSEVGSWELGNRYQTIANPLARRSRPQSSRPILSRRDYGAPCLEKPIANMQPRRSLVRSRE